MPWWSFLLIAIPAIAVIVVAVLVILSQCKYVRRASMLTDPENYFYHLLRSLLPAGYVLVPQAPMIACFDAKKRDRTALNRILSKRFDYAVVKTERLPDFPFQRLVTVTVIELDDASHQRPARKRRDKFVEKICRMNRLPLLRFRSLPNQNPDYDVSAIRRDLFRALELGDVYR